MPRGGPQPNAGRKPVPNSQTICWTLQQSTIELVKAEAKRHRKTPGVFAGQILAEVLQVNRLTAIRAGKGHALKRSRLALGGAFQVRRQIAKGEETRS